MGLQISAAVLCDNCLGTNTPLTSLDSAEAALPDNWMKVQGYANVSNGSAESLLGYFCPVCVDQVSSRDLVKKAADVSPDFGGE